MSQEIEKKYLVYSPKLPSLSGGTLYIQGYLSLKPLIRYRVVGNKITITIKNVAKNGISREEWEFEKIFTKDEIAKIVKLSIKKPIQKIRHRVPFVDLVWEIDIYQGENKGLVTTEVEIPKENYKIIYPEWVDKSHEITNDPKYFNVNLGDNPFKKWKQKN